MAWLERAGNCGRWQKSLERSRIWILILALVCAIAAGAIFLTKENAFRLTSGGLQTINENCEVEADNPLVQCDDPEITQTVQEYYGELTDTAEYVEGYENLQIYLKNGLYRDTYIVFACYDMKIRDIYTPVPGLSTLYVEKTEEQYHVADDMEEEVQELVTAVAAHEDVKALLGQVQIRYATAVESDAMLQESLQDLQEASISSATAE